ncbi:M56 family metallopeptidase [Terriglobus sp. TAA 43]|uniref:M56 family metallopeptidase n=1 Tax=Terriglobus sp. TAA 43 TaxID=278961 RepID=UPI0006489C10|nr:M56 family metallopeptidase [Terriglobus sp. TAA 43]
MISPIWNESSLANVINHLLQSTIFASIAWVVVLTLRKSPARTRYWVWMIASLKFLLPLSLLMAAGRWLRSLAPMPIATKPLVTNVVEHMARPFQQTQFFEASEHAAVSSHGHWMLVLALAVWICGVTIIVLRWVSGWRHIRVAKRSGFPLNISANVPVLCSTTTIEPGIYGIFRPVLLLPEGILRQLTPQQLKAVIAHEMCHVRRRDNLTFAVHMIVEALLWFHPVVWWIGAQLIDERERACDEAVLEAGNDAQDYAAAILNVCRFYVELPLKCASGVTGSDLKERILRIAAHNTGAKLPFGTKLALFVLATMAIAMPLAFGLVQATKATPTWEEAAGSKMEFAVASIRLDKSGVFKPPSIPIGPDNSLGKDGPVAAGLFTADFHVGDYISFAYKLNADQRKQMYASLPTWAATENFEIHARSELAHPTKDQLRLMMQSLLADRFKLTFHQETRQLSVFALTEIEPGKIGPNLIDHAEGPPCDAPSLPVDGSTSVPVKAWPPSCGLYVAHMTSGQIFEVGSRDTTMDLVASSLSSLGQLERPMIDGTGLTGRFDFILRWTPSPSSPILPPGTTLSPDAEGTTFTEALKDQLGMKLKPTKSPMQILVVDHLERPSEN